MSKEEKTTKLSENWLVMMRVNKVRERRESEFKISVVKHSIQILNRLIV